MADLVALLPTAAGQKRGPYKELGDKVGRRPDDERREAGRRRPRAMGDKRPGGGVPFPSQRRGKGIEGLWG